MLNEPQQSPYPLPSSEAAEPQHDPTAASSPLSVLKRPLYNLPCQLSSFVGREYEMREVKQLLASTRLLTLTGAGGSGKTRLALQVAQDLIAAPLYTDGVWFVDLAGLSDPALVPQAIAANLGVREASIQPLIETLADYLRAKKILLLLDNCEHLIDACAQVATTFLCMAPGLHILATSREALRISGERVWPVPPLSLPSSDRLATIDELSQSEAVRLFVNRATAVLPTFALNHHTAAAVAQVCQRLDGIPLAIELAAARMNVLSVEHIAARLDDTIRLLTTGSRTALPRHQTLWAAIDWSYTLLSEHERILFRRLAVFAGGFGLEAAEVVSADGLGQDNRLSDKVLDVLSGLVTKSLVIVDRPGAQARYRLLETVRQYAQERLHASGEAELLRHRHAAYYQELAEEGEPKFKTQEQLAWIRRFEQEHDNFRAVLSWTLQVAGRAETALRIGAALVFFWWMRGYLSEGRSWLERALASSVPSRPILAKALVAAGRLALLQRDVEPARAYFEQGLILFQEARDIWGTAWALTGIAEIESDTERKRALAEKSLAQFRSTGDHWGIGFALYTLAELARLSGEDTRAATLFEESAAKFRAAGDQRGIGFVLLSLGRTWLHVGDHVRAASVLAESLALLAGVEDRGTGMAAVLQGLGSLAHERGDQERAAKLYGAAEALHEAAGTRRLIDHEDWKRSVTRMRERLGDDKFMAAWGDGRAMTLEQAIAEAAYVIQPETAKARLGYGAGLTDRELEVLRLVAEGLRDEQVAERLVISRRTVHAHLRSIYGKLGVRSRTEATRCALEHKL